MTRPGTARFRCWATVLARARSRNRQAEGATEEVLARFGHAEARGRLPLTEIVFVNLPIDPQT